MDSLACSYWNSTFQCREKPLVLRGFFLFAISSAGVSNLIPIFDTIFQSVNSDECNNIFPFPSCIVCNVSDRVSEIEHSKQFFSVLRILQRAWNVRICSLIILFFSEEFPDSFEESRLWMILSLQIFDLFSLKIYFFKKSSVFSSCFLKCCLISSINIEKSLLFLHECSIR